VIYAIFIDFVCSITNVCLNKTVVQIPVDDLRKGTPLLLTCLHTSRYIHNSPIHMYMIKKNQVRQTGFLINLCSLQKSSSKLIFVGYTSSTNPVRNRLKILFVELDFSNLICQKSSTDGQSE